MRKINGEVLLLKTNRPQFAPVGSQLCSSIPGPWELCFTLSFQSTIIKLPNHTYFTYFRFCFLLVVIMSIFCPVKSICRSQLRQLSVVVFSHSINEDFYSDSGSKINLK